MPSSLFFLRAGETRHSGTYVQRKERLVLRRRTPARALRRRKSGFEARCPNHGELTALDRALSGRSLVLAQTTVHRGQG